MIILNSLRIKMELPPTASVMTLRVNIAFHFDSQGYDR